MSEMDRHASKLTEIETSAGLPDWVKKHEVSERFLTDAIKKAQVLESLYTVFMTEATRTILVRVPFTSLLQPLQEDVDIGNSVKGTFRHIVLSPSEFGGALAYTYTAIEDMIRGNQYPQMVLDEAKNAVAADLERLVFAGGTNPGDTFLSAKDGVIKILRDAGRAFDAGGDQLDWNILTRASLNIEEEYRSPGLTVFCSRRAFLDLASQYLGRPTNVGDSILTKGVISGDVAGLPIREVWVMGLLDDDTNHTTSVLITDPKNIVLAIRRDVTIEPERKPASRQVHFYITVRVDIKVITPQAAAVVDNLSYQTTPLPQV